MRVLLTVADRSSRTLLSTYLRDCGHEMEIVSNGLGCITSLCENPPDVVILEQGVLWGGSDGVMSRMKESPSLSAIPMVLLSSDGFQFDPANLLRIEAFVRTPMRLEDLLRIGNMLNGLDVSSNRVPVNRVVKQGAML